MALQELVFMVPWHNKVPGDAGDLQTFNGEPDRRIHPVVLADKFLVLDGGSPSFEVGGYHEVLVVTEEDATVIGKRGARLNEVRECGVIAILAVHMGVTDWSDIHLLAIGHV